MSDMDAHMAHVSRLVSEVDCGPDCSCEEFAEHLFELLDAQIPQAQAERLRAHAEGCPNCTELSEVEEHLRLMLRKACCEQSAPQQLRERIVQQFAFYADDSGVVAEFSRTQYRDV